MNLFNIKEIITIVMTLIEKLEEERLCGFEREEIYLPKDIDNKLEILSRESYEDFIGKCRWIADEVYELKSGELNELNCMHQEIAFIAKEELEKYIIN